MAALNLRHIYIIGGIFAILQALAIAMEFYYFSLLPAVILVILLAFFKLDYLILSIVFMAPVSVNLESLEMGGLGLFLPTEPLLIGVLLLFFMKLLTDSSIDKRIFTHPVSWAIYAYFIWIFFTSFTSAQPLVSFKYLISRAWFVVSFYFIAAHLFKNYKNLDRYFWLYMFPLFFVMLYTMTRHAMEGFEHDPAHWVMTPFFNDHTSYGAALAFTLPMFIGMLLTDKIKTTSKLLLIPMLAIFATALVLSYTRAAWVSLIAAGAVGAFMYFRIKLSTLIIATVLGAVFLVFSLEQLLMDLERNKQDSSDSLSEHVESISNISSDASNLERLNRWNAALRMFEERPLVGFGPGTYAFEYAPYQSAADRTIITTDSGDAGNAHSEYLGPLAEMGLLGPLLYLLIIIIVTVTAFRVVYALPNGHLKMIAITAYLGLFTYYVHGVLNNFLDTDKISCLFWGFTAMIVALDLFHLPKKQ
ncbi:MAG: O-antigen ligase family protein [Flavobacteriales bacterium]